MNTATSPSSWLPDPHATFLQVLAGHVARVPDRVAYTALGARGRQRVPRPVSFAQLWSSATHASAALRERGVEHGARVLLSVDRTETFLSYFLGAQLLGAIPVPLPAMTMLELPASFCERLEAVARDCEPAAVVVDSTRSKTHLADALGERAVVIMSEGSELEAEAPQRTPRLDPTIDGETIALLQYTSGSTSRPKGVIVRHRNLTANFRAIALGASFGPDEVSVSWLPLYHDMGIIGGLLLGLWMCTGTVVMTPRHFLLQPESWLWAIHEHRATFTVGPNFAYNLVTRKASDRSLEGLDLSSLRLAFDGAEPVDPGTLDAFVRRFSRYGLREHAMYPVYGLAECTLAVAFPPAGSRVQIDRVEREGLAARAEASPSEHEDEAVRFVSVGSAVPEHTVCIRTPGGDDELPDRHVGEICVSGPSCSTGYWGRAPADGELRTGDLGYLAEGQLFVIDRLRDLVIVGGRNYAPCDIERAAATVEGIAAGGVIAFAVPGDEGTEQLCVVASLRATTARSVDELRRDVELAVHRAVGLRPTHTQIVPPGTLPKTSSGKLRRQACRESFVAGELADASGVGTRATIVLSRLRREVLRAVALRRPTSRH